jgi:hypothetical protein
MLIWCVCIFPFCYIALIKILQPSVHPYVPFEFNFGTDCKLKESVGPHHRNLSYQYYDFYGPQIWDKNKEGGGVEDWDY